MKFSIEQDGVETPVGLYYDDECVLYFEKGLKGPGVSQAKNPIIKDLFNNYEVLIFNTPHNPLFKYYPEAKGLESIFPNEDGYGIAFFLLAFDQLRKSDPTAYHWEK